MDKPSRLLKALADQTRVRILSLLARDEQWVCGLQAMVRLPQPTISRHLAYLRRLGLVEECKDGKWMIYRLAPARDGVHGAMLRCLRGCFGEVDSLRKDATRRAEIRSPRCCGGQ